MLQHRECSSLPGSPGSVTLAQYRMRLSHFIDLGGFLFYMETRAGEICLAVGCWKDQISNEL